MFTENNQKLQENVSYNNDDDEDNNNNDNQLFIEMTLRILKNSPLL